jgi:hypothetical protein
MNSRMRAFLGISVKIVASGLNFTSTSGSSTPFQAVSEAKLLSLLRLVLPNTTRVYHAAVELSRRGIRQNSAGRPNSYESGYTLVRPPKPKHPSSPDDHLFSRLRCHTMQRRRFSPQKDGQLRWFFPQRFSDRRI